MMKIRVRLMYLGTLPTFEILHPGSSSHRNDYNDMGGRSYFENRVRTS